MKTTFNKIIKSIFMCLLCALCLSSNVVFAEDSKSTELTYTQKAKVSFVNELEHQTYEYEYDLGDKLVEQAHSEIDDYIFLGWYLNDVKWNFDVDTVLDSISLKAKYIKVEGIIKDITNPSENDCNASMDIKADDIPLTDQDIVLLNEGKELDVKLVVDIVEPISVPQQDKALIDNKIEQLNETFAQYIDIQLLKTINNVTTNINKTNNEIKVSIQIPEEYRTTDREYTLYRVHDDVLEVMYQGRPQDNWIITFMTDKFSTYGLSYKKTDTHHEVPEYRIPNTGVTGKVLYQGNHYINSINIVALCSLLLISCLTFIRIVNKHNN